MSNTLCMRDSNGPKQIQISFKIKVSFEKFMNIICKIFSLNMNMKIVCEEHAQIYWNVWYTLQESMDCMKVLKQRSSEIFVYPMLLIVSYSW